jgi:hypothetical protein
VGFDSYCDHSYVSIDGSVIDAEPGDESIPPSEADFIKSCKFVPYMKDGQATNFIFMLPPGFLFSNVEN